MISISLFHSLTVSPIAPIIYSVVGVVSAILIVIVVVAITIIIWRQRCHKREAQPVVDMPEVITIECKNYSTILVRGKYKWQEVAIKIYHCSCKHLWEQERDLYLDTPLKHANVLKFIATDVVARKKKKKAPDYLIIFEYPVLGTLRDYLQYHKLSLKDFLRLSMSATSGLEYLHDLGNGQLSVAHGDIGSHSLHVRLDGTCAIGNLEHAIQFKTREDEMREKLYVSEIIVLIESINRSIARPQYLN